jgi:hypothetical protein
MQYLTELVRAVIRHPFELLGVRMIISSAPEYSSLFSALWFHFSNNDLLSLFVGIRQSLFNGLFIPLQSQQFLLIGLPTLLRIRRMLPPPGSQSFNGGLGGFEPHAGLGGSVKLLTDMLKQDGLIGLLSCARVTFDIALPAAVSLLIARGIGSLIIGPTREQAIKTEIRLSYLKEMFKPRKKGNLRRRLSSSQLFRDSSSSNFLLSSSSSTDLSSALSSSPSKSPTSNVSTSVSPSSLTEPSSSSSSSEGGTKALSVSGFDSNYSVSHPSSSKSSSFTSTPLETIPPSPESASAQLFYYPTSLPSNPPDVSKLTSVPSEDGFFIDE